MRTSCVPDDFGGQNGGSSPRSLRSLRVTKAFRYDLSLRKLSVTVVSSAPSACRVSPASRKGCVAWLTSICGLEQAEIHTDKSV